MTVQRPTIFYQGNYSSKDIEVFKQENQVVNELDLIDSQLKELFKVSHPELLYSHTFDDERAIFIQDELSGGKSIYGNWVYLPWNASLIHILGEEEYYILRTNRNRNLISSEEQQKLNKLCIGVVGLSIGSNIVTSIAYEGISNRMKLAEFDNLETTNLNRVRAGIHHLSGSKMSYATQKMYEINPYAQLEIFPDGLNIDALPGFLENTDVVFDEIDDFKMKIQLRIEAKKNKIPVIMITNVDNTILIDIERYDKDPSIELFNGILGHIPNEIINKTNLTPSEAHEYAIKFVGREYVSERAFNSVTEIGKTLIGRPQLNSTVTIGSGIAAYLVRELFLTDDLSSGRKVINIKKLL